jgi:hypothetical protein
MIVESSILKMICSPPIPVRYFIVLSRALVRPVDMYGMVVFHLAAQQQSVSQRRQPQYC